MISAGYSALLIAAFFSVAGAAFDKLIPSRFKGKLQLRMIAVWDRIHTTAVPDFLNVFAAAIIEFIERKTKNSNLRLVLGYLIASWVVISLGSFLGFSNIASFRSLFPWNALATFDFRRFVEDSTLPHALSYVGVYVYDILTLVVTVWTLDNLRTAKGARACLVIAAHNVMTITLAVLCFTAFFAGNVLSVEYDMLGAHSARKDWVDAMIAQAQKSTPALTQEVQVINFRDAQPFGSDFHRVPDVLWRLAKGEKTKWPIVFEGRVTDGVNWVTVEASGTLDVTPAAILLTGTVFLPSLAIVFFLLSMIGAKILLKLSRGTILYYLDLSTEGASPKDFAPGIITGSVFGLVAAALKLIFDFLQLAHGKIPK